MALDFEVTPNRPDCLSVRGIAREVAALSGATLDIGQLGTPTDAALTGVFVSSMSATWSLVAGATGYTLAASLSPANPPTAVYASSVTVGNASVSASVFSPALAADTVYYLFVRANGSEVSSAWAPLPAAATLLSKAPVFSSFSNVYYSSAQFNWSANGNPAGTLYRVYVSTAYNPLLPAGAVSTSSDTYNTWLSSSGLSSNTTYYFRVAGVNKDGVATAYTTARATSTLVSAPLAAGFGPVSASAVQFNWAANGTMEHKPLNTTGRVNHAHATQHLHQFRHQRHQTPRMRLRARQTIHSIQHTTIEARRHQQTAHRTLGRLLEPTREHTIHPTPAAPMLTRHMLQLPIHTQHATLQVNAIPRQPQHLTQPHTGQQQRPPQRAIRHPQP